MSAKIYNPAQLYGLSSNRVGCFCLSAPADRAFGHLSEPSKSFS